MTFYQVFLRFCKENKMMGDVLKIYYSRGYGTVTEWGHDEYFRFTPLRFRRFSLENFIKMTVRTYLSTHIFDRIESGSWKEENCFIDYSKNYKIGKKKWRYFIKNNVKIDANYVKIGDKIEIDGFTRLKGNVCGIDLSDFSICYSDGERYYNANIFDGRLLINGEHKEPQFYIERKKQFYYGIKQG